MKNCNRPSHQLAPHHWLLATMLAAALGLGFIIMSVKSDSHIQQVFNGPVNAPVNTCLSADQKADVRGEVGR